MPEFAEEGFIEDVASEEGLDGGEGIPQTEEGERTSKSEYVILSPGAQRG